MKTPTMRRSYLTSAVALFVMALSLLLFPELDLRFTEIFYDPVHGFLISDPSTPKFLRWVTVIVINGLLILFLANWIRRKSSQRSDFLFLTYRDVIFLLLALGIGPGLLVNGVLKPHSGRARPYQVAAFGGTKKFTAALVPAVQCRKNCSFVSGDAAIGYYFLAFVFVARKWRRGIVLLGISLGTSIGLFRIAQGAHFLSDVVFAGLLTFLVAWLLSVLLKVRYQTDRTVLPSFMGNLISSSVRDVADRHRA